MDTNEENADENTLYAERKTLSLGVERRSDIAAELAKRNAEDVYLFHLMTVRQLLNWRSCAARKSFQPPAPAKICTEWSISPGSRREIP